MISAIDKFTVNAIIQAFTLRQRNVNYLFRKETSVNKSHLEILTFSNTVACFNPYQVQQYFKQMNLQQVRLAIKKLVQINAVELFSRGIKNKPAVYIITNRGKELLSVYNQIWHNNVIPT